MPSQPLLEAARPASAPVLQIRIPVRLVGAILLGARRDPPRRARLVVGRRSEPQLRDRKARGELARLSRRGDRRSRLPGLRPLDPRGAHSARRLGLEFHATRRAEPHGLALPRLAAGERPRRRHPELHRRPRKLAAAARTRRPHRQRLLRHRRDDHRRRARSRSPPGSSASSWPRRRSCSSGSRSASAPCPTPSAARPQRRRQGQRQGRRAAAEDDRPERDGILSVVIGGLVHLAYSAQTAARRAIQSAKDRREAEAPEWRGDEEPTLERRYAAARYAAGSEPQVVAAPHRCRRARGR